ncbi:MAG: hypothetical protein V1867_07475 [Candidatus Falkowbacteria bacterium]
MEENQDLIRYEFELEQEQRIMIDPGGYTIEKWVNHVIDVYDPSGRCRIRLKNGRPRLSIKVPLLSRDTARTKCCIRLEFKPETKEQEEDLLKIRDLILTEPGTQTAEKWGTPISLNNGEKVWVNKDIGGNYWIETDESARIEELLPEGVNYLKHAKSGIDLTREPPAPAPDFGKAAALLRKNLEVTSRTVNGQVDISVSDGKEKPALSEKDLCRQAKANCEDLIRYMGDNRNRNLADLEDLRKILYDITGIVNRGIAKNPLALRFWPVKYGRRVPPESIPAEMEVFLRVLYGKIREAENGELKPRAIGRWIEFEFDGNIHPLADGCGRVAKALSALFLTRFGSNPPGHASRKEYYDAMNGGETTFGKYYDSVFEND